MVEQSAARAVATSYGTARWWRRTPLPAVGSDVVRWVLLAGWVFILSFAIINGARPARLGQLESALAAGQVGTIAVTPGLPSNASGSVTQDLYWRQGLLRYHAEVVMTTPDASDQASQQGDAAVRSGSDIAAELGRYNPLVKTVRISHPKSSAEIYGWRLPGWLGWLGFAAIVCTLTLLVSGPQPWRATRWAWFWLMTNPVGTILFLVLAGPTPPLRSPRNPKRRLTGGWAFLLGLVLARFLPHWG